MHLWHAKSKKDSIILFSVYGLAFLILIIIINYAFNINNIVNTIVTLIGIYFISFRFLYPITKGSFDKKI